MSDSSLTFIEMLEKFPVLGEGKLGKVYKINELTCVKVNRNEHVNQKELAGYKKYGSSAIFPRVYFGCQNVIVMEYIDGIQLAGYLEQGNRLKEWHMKALVGLFAEAYKIRLLLNPNARHVILTKSGKARVVDLEDQVKFASPKPFMLFHKLKKFQQKELFINYVKKNSPELYKKWYGRPSKKTSVT